MSQLLFHYLCRAELSKMKLTLLVQKINESTTFRERKSKTSSGKIRKPTHFSRIANGIFNYNEFFYSFIDRTIVRVQPVNVTKRTVHFSDSCTIISCLLFL